MNRSPDDIRCQLGDRYFMLPIFAGRWVCAWHRRRPDQKTFNVPLDFKIDEKVTPPCETTRSALWPTGERSRSAGTKKSENLELAEINRKWPKGARLNATKSLGLPQPELPDGAWVVLIPTAKELFGALAPHEREALKAASKLARPILLDHAYHVALERLQRWQDIGPDYNRAQVELRRLNVTPEGTNDGSEPSRDYVRDWELASWISHWACDLYEKNPTPKFTPYERAFEILYKCTGFKRSTVEKELNKV